MQKLPLPSSLRPRCERCPTHNSVIALRSLHADEDARAIDRVEACPRRNSADRAAPRRPGVADPRCRITPGRVQSTSLRWSLLRLPRLEAGPARQTKAQIVLAEEGSVGALKRLRLVLIQPCDQRKGLASELRVEGQLDGEGLSPFGRIAKRLRAVAACTELRYRRGRRSLIGIMGCVREETQPRPGIGWIRGLPRSSITWPQNWSGFWPRL